MPECRPLRCTRHSSVPDKRRGRSCKHAASAQNLQKPSAGFLLRFPKRHRQLLPQDTLYHLVEVGIHGVDLSAAALLLGLLLPQLLEQGQVLVKIIGVQQRLIVFCQRRLNSRRDGQRLRFDPCKVGCCCCAGVTGRRTPSFAVGI